MKYKPTNDELAQLYYNASGAKTFYKGTSFRCNVWENNTHYFHNEQYIDFVIYERNLLMCLRDHLSSKDNAPEKKLVGDQYQVLNSPLWEVVIAQLDQVQTLPAGGSVGQILVKQSNEDYDIVWSDAPETGAADITAIASAINSEQTSVSVDVNKAGSAYTLSFDFELQKGLDGAPGKDGHTPIIGVAKDTDGFYYWTIDEEWLLDAEHNKIKATGIDGKDGQNGVNGQDGKDGSDQQSIYTITVDPEIDASLDPSKLDSQQEDSFIPNGWFDVPQQVTIQQPYQLQSTRYKRNGTWSKYSDPIIYNQYWQDGNFFEVSFTSFVFCKTSKTWLDTDIKPSGGSYENPFPVNSGTIGREAVEWVDSIPVGIGQVWISSATFTNNSEEVTWSTPVPMSDTNDFQVEYSSAEHPVNPESLQSYYDSDLTNYETSWRQNNPDWTDKGENAIWMATCKMHNGEWGEWSINKIKGEDGNDGTSVAIKEGNYTSESDLPENANIGDCYLIDGNLWAWDGDSWVNAGNIKGDPGTNGKDGVDGKDGINGTDGKDGAPGADGKDGNDGLSAWVHVKYATVEPANDYVFDENNIWSGFTESNGETPGPYIGIYADHNEDDSLDPTKYKWTKWQGEDGWGYEYIYALTSEEVAPDLPDSIQSDDDVPENWSDDPLSVSKNTPYCWVCFRVKKNGVWSEYKGIDGKASLWAKWSNDGRGIDYIKEEYGLSSEIDSEPTEWSDTVPRMTPLLCYLWNRTTIYYDDKTNDPGDAMIIGVHGQDGRSFTIIGEVTQGSLYESYEIEKEGSQSWKDGYAWIVDKQFYIFSGHWDVDPEEAFWVMPVAGVPGEKGDKGEPGAPGPIVYPAGIWNENKTYKKIGDTVPYVEYNDNYYICIGTSTLETPDVDTTNWVIMPQFDSIFTKILVAEHGTIGQAVYSGKYMFSQTGTKSDGGGSYASTDYQDFVAHDSIDQILNDESENFIPSLLFNFADGSGYLHNGAIKFDESGVEIGKNVNIKADLTIGEFSVNRYSNRSFVFANNGSWGYDIYSNNQVRTLRAYVQTEQPVIYVSLSDYTFTTEGKRILEGCVITDAGKFVYFNDADVSYPVDQYGVLQYIVITSDAGNFEKFEVKPLNQTTRTNKQYILNSINIQGFPLNAATATVTVYDINDNVLDVIVRKVDNTVFSINEMKYYDTEPANIIVTFIMGENSYDENIIDDLDISIVNQSTYYSVSITGTLRDINMMSL